MKEYITELQKERKKLLMKIDKIDKAITAFQNLCNHKNEDGSSAMEHEGHDSHKDFYKCSICGYETFF